MRRNAVRDGKRYARVPTGPEPCAYCAMLASRGFVYRSESSAPAATGHFHHGCRCKVVPETAGSVEGYDPDEWLGRWQAMRDIDADPRLTAAQKLEAKGRMAGKAADTPLAFSLRFPNSSTDLYRYAEKVPPLEGYEDVFIHSDGLSFSYTDADDEAHYTMTPKQLADSLRESPDYKGGPIRLIACDSGSNGKESAAQFLANELGVEVLAPDKTAMIDENGVMHLADTRSEFMKIDAGIIEESGKWIVFKPER